MKIFHVFYLFCLQICIGSVFYSSVSLFGQMCCRREHTLYSVMYLWCVLLCSAAYHNTSTIISICSQKLFDRLLWKSAMNEEMVTTSQTDKSRVDVSVCWISCLSLVLMFWFGSGTKTTVPVSAVSSGPPFLAASLSSSPPPPDVNVICHVWPKCQPWTYKWFAETSTANI